MFRALVLLFVLVASTARAESVYQILKYGCEGYLKVTRSILNSSDGTKIKLNEFGDFVSVHFDESRKILVPKKGRKMVYPEALMPGEDELEFRLNDERILTYPDVVLDQNQSGKLKTSGPVLFEEHDFQFKVSFNKQKQFKVKYFVQEERKDIHTSKNIYQEIDLDCVSKSADSKKMTRSNDEK